MTEDDSKTSGSDLLAALDWQIAMGANEATGDVAIDRYADVGRQAREEKATQQANVKAVSWPKRTDLAGPAIKHDATCTNAPLGASEAAAKSAKIAAASQSLDMLKDAILAFDGCALKQTAGSTVFGVGPLRPDVMVMGETPDDSDDKQGLPFSGQAGDLLDQMLKAIGLDRKDIYLANAIYWRPPGKRSLTESELAICLPLVRRQIELVAPKQLLLLGKIPTNLLLANRDSIKKQRGKWTRLELTSGALHALPTFHPSFLLKNPLQKRLAWQDLLAFKLALSQNA